jgi:predicted nucleotidyltransferase
MEQVFLSAAGGLRLASFVRKLAKATKKQSCLSCKSCQICLFVLSSYRYELHTFFFTTAGTQEQRMIKFSKLPDNIEALILDAASYLRSREEVVFAYLFGSLAKGKRTPLSDIDIAVYFSTEHDLPEKKLEILGGLNDILETDEVDLVMLNSAPLSLEIGILENKQVIVDKDPFFRHKYESLVMRKSFDFSVKESTILRSLFRGR